MITKWIAVTLTLMLSSAPSAASPVSRAGPDSSYRQLLQATGIEAQLQLVRQFVMEAAVDNARRCRLISPDRQHSALDHYAPNQLREATVRQIKQQISPAEARELLRWYQSDIGLSVSRLEKIALEQIAPSAQTTRLIQLLARRNPDNNPRATALQQIVDDTRVPDYAAMIATEIEYAGVMFSGCALEISNPATSDAELQRAQSIRSERGLLLQIVRYEAPQEMALSLQSLPDEALMRYRQFTSSALAQRFFAALIGSFSASLAAASNQMSEQLQAPDLRARATH